MSKRSAIPPRGELEPFPSTLRKFRHTVFSSRRGILSGVNTARRVVPPRHIAPLVRAVSQTPNFSPALPQAFPQSYAQIFSLPRLHAVDLERELLWSSALLSLHAEQLNAFVQDRKRVEECVISSSWEGCLRALDEAEKRHGHSVWSIGTRIQVLQIKEGLKAQKDYLERVLATEGVSGLFGYVAYLLSVRAEENTTLETLHLEVDDLPPASPVGDLARFFAVPFEPEGLVSIESLVACCISAGAIDRLHNVVYALQLLFSRQGAGAIPLISRVLEILAHVDEPGLRRLRKLVGFTSDHSDTDSIGLTALDAYTSGRYQEVPLIPDLFDLYARSRLFVGDYVAPAPGMTSDYISWVLGQAYVGSADGLKVYDELERAVLALASHPVSIHIAAALSRLRGDKAGSQQKGEIQLVAAVSGCTLNPWSLEVMAEAGVAVSDQLPSSSRSSTLLLHQAVRDPNGGAAIARLEIPEYRRQLYLGHWHRKAGRLQEAAHHYQSALVSDIPYVRVQSAVGLFTALSDLLRDADAINLFVKHCLEYPSSQHKFEIGPVLERSLDDSSLSGTIQFAVALHIAWRHGGSDWALSISDVLQNVLDRYSAAYPSELVVLVPAEDRQLLVYFLANVCALRFLEDTTLFSSLEEVEAERIRICQRLVELDAGRSEAYSNEIKVVTRDARAAQLLQQVQSNYIFVDEDGLQESVGPHIRVLFDRYIALLQAPEMNYRSENISRQLVRLLDKDEDTGLKNLRLPTSEREALFSNIVNSFVVGFATNSAFGLDPHLSTSIRHGTFEGPLISALAANDLLSQADTDGESMLPERWRRELPEASHETVRRALGKLSGRVQGLIEDWTKRYLHIWHPETATEGLFNFHTTSEVKGELMSTVTTSTPFEELWLRLSNHCWAKVDSSTSVIRQKIIGELLPQLNSALHALASTVSDAHSHSLGPLLDSIARAQLQLQTATEDISRWFVRSESSQREDFEIEWAFDVARRQIQNCYVRAGVSYTEHYGTQRKLRGKHFDGMVEVCFILLQNAVRHSHLESDLRVSIEVEEEEGNLRLTVGSGFAPDIDVAGLLQVAAEAERRYNRESALKRTRSEGGSGLSKVWRILEHDIKARHELSINVLKDESRFRVSLLIGGLMEEL